MLIRMLRQSWKYGIKRKLLAIITLFLASGLISSLLAVSLDIGDKMAKELKSYGANILIEPASNAILPEIEGHLTLTTQDLLDEKELANVKDIFWRNNIVGFAPLLQANIEINGQALVALGTFFDHHLTIPDEENYHTGQKIISPYWQVKGEWVDDSHHIPLDQRIPVLLGTKLAQQFDWHIGQQLNVVYVDKNYPQDSPHFMPIIIKGILTTGGNEEQQVIFPLQALQHLTGLEGKIQGIKVSALTVPENDLSRKARANIEGLDAEEYDRWYCTAYVSSIAHQLEEAISGAVVRPIWQVAASEGVIIEKIQLLLFVVTLAALLAAAMGISSLMGSSIMERSKEIGLMKALGAYQWQITLLFYCEASINGIIGGTLGCLAGWGLAGIIGQKLFGEPLGFALILIPCVLLLSVIIALIGTWFPAHRIARLYPIEVLYGR
ncbi:ABC transporter permease [Volucribacter amazonae]|uniref:ABC transporter permease n=1 Tax=Volucribacter amazonae TaxID=256731 RepID=A0A9X4PCC5_9PAST|nr:ABC transporter permease [Volucribacter amazonae]MDG6894649.1 ABC transporter permease [Volucribacter amazonae]